MLVPSLQVPSIFSVMKLSQNRSSEINRQLKISSIGFYTNEELLE